jgi:hypothetical protein
MLSIMANILAWLISVVNTLWLIYLQIDILIRGANMLYIMANIKLGQLLEEAIKKAGYSHRKLAMEAGIRVTIPFPVTRYHAVLADYANILLSANTAVSIAFPMSQLLSKPVNALAWCFLNLFLTYYHV